MNLGALMNFMRGGASPEDFAELLESLGLKVKAQEIDGDQFPAHFHASATVAMRPDARGIAFRGVTRTGDEVAALIIFAPFAQEVTAEPQKMLDSPAIGL